MSGGLAGMSNMSRIMFNYKTTESGFSPVAYPSHKKPMTINFILWGNLFAEIRSPRRRTFRVQSNTLHMSMSKNPFCFHFLPIISGGFITCGQKEALNSHFYLIIGYLDISNLAV